MAWADDLLDASFKGIVFDCVRVSDEFGKAVARNAYPYRDGEDIEDLGGMAREFSITAVFFGDDYKERAEEFLDAISSPGHGELVHPVFGSIERVQFLGGSLTHDAEMVDFCSIDLRFVEATPREQVFVGSKVVQQAEAAAQVADEAMDSGTSVFDQAMDGLKALQGIQARANALRGVLNGTLAPIRELVTGFTTTTMDLLDFPRAFVGDVVGMLGMVTDLRTFDPGAIIADWSALLDDLGNVVKLPALSSGSTPGVPPAQPEDVAHVTGVVQLAVATSMAKTAIDVLAADAEEPTMTPIEIEAIAADTREALQEAVEFYRATYDLSQSRPVTERLKATALAVQDIARAALEQRPVLMQRTVDAPANLALIAHRWYGNHRRSVELLRLNPQVRNPNFIERGDALRCYAE